MITASKSIKSVRQAGVVLLLVLAVGCGHHGPEREGVHGQVWLDDLPIETGSIAFVPMGATAGPSAGAEIVDGSYEVDADRGLFVGRYKVQIRALKKTGKKVPNLGLGPDPFIDEIVNAVPAQYNTATILEFEVQPNEENVADFHLQSECAHQKR